MSKRSDHKRGQEIKNANTALYIMASISLGRIEHACNVVSDSLEQNPFFESFLQLKEGSNPPALGVAENKIR